MYDLDALEKKWQLYKKNKYKKLLYKVVSFVGVATLSAGVTYSLMSTSGTKQPQQQTIIAQPQQITDKNQTMAPQLVSMAQPTAPKEIVIVSQNEDKTEQFKSLEQKSQVEQVPTPTVQAIPNKVEPKVAPKIHMETKNVGVVEALEDRYSKQPSYAVALTLSSEYYKTKDYQKALYWAINANSLDTKGDKSWIMFAKASYKLGKKNDAINALENYLRNSQSENARVALSQIKNNEL